MRSSPRWLLLPCLLGACAKAPPRDTQADVSAINAVREHEAMLVSAGSTDSMATLYTDNVVMMPPGEPMVEGIDAFKRWAAAMFSQANLSVKYDKSEVMVAGDWALDRYTGTLIATPKAGVTAVKEEVKGIHFLQRQGDGSWKIAVDVWNMNAPPPTPPPAPLKKP
jgi:ketosteroid isomerase-like protein